MESFLFSMSVTQQIKINLTLMTLSFSAELTDGHVVLIHVLVNHVSGELVQVC